MYLGYLSFAEIEIVNEARLHAYATAMDFPPTCELECATLRTSLEHAVYTTPAADNAPWYDPAIPESADVAGFSLFSVTGLGSTISRPFIATNTGVSIGTVIPSPRQMVLRFGAHAKNECASDYAVQWLLKTLAGLNCNQPNYPRLPSRPCGGDDMCFFSCCPTSPADVPTRLMTIFKAGLTGSSIIDSQPIYDCAGILCEVEVTLAADPYIWRTPFTALDVTMEGATLVGTSDQLFPSNCFESDCFIPSPPGCDLIEPLEPPLPPVPCIGGVTTIDGRQELSMNEYLMPLDMSGVSKKLLSAPIITWEPSDEFGTDIPIMFGLSRQNCADEKISPCIMEATYLVPGYSGKFVLDTRISAAYQIPDGCPIFVTDDNLAPSSWDRLACAEEMCLRIWVNADTDLRAGNVTVQFATEFTAGC